MQKIKYKLNSKIRIWFVGLGIVMIVLLVGCVQKPEEIKPTPTMTPGTPTEPDLTLSNYPKSFEKDVIIVIGENATQIEMEGAHAIADNLGNLTGNAPVIKKDDEIKEDEKAKYNLILVGRPDTNSLLVDVYEKTKATKVTNEYPGANKGTLEILRSPWNENKPILLVAGSDEEGTVAGINELYWLYLSKRNFEKAQGSLINVVGTLKMPMASWSPSFDKCISPSYFIETDSGEIYYLENICNYLYIYNENLTSNSKKVVVTTEKLHANSRVEVMGKFEKKEVNVPARKEQNAPTKKGTFNVIVISDLKFLN